MENINVRSTIWNALLIYCLCFHNSSLSSFISPLEVYFISLKGLIHQMCYQTSTSKGVLFPISRCFRYFSNSPLFTKYFSISLSVFLSITNIVIFYDYTIYAISSSTFTSQVFNFLKSMFPPLKLNSIILLSEYWTLYLILTYDFISNPTKFRSHQNLHWMTNCFFTVSISFVLSFFF